MVVELEKRQNIPLKPAAVPIEIEASALVTDKAKARTVGIKSFVKSIVKGRSLLNS
jgi:hypothetical protein